MKRPLYFLLLLLFSSLACSLVERTAVTPSTKVIVRTATPLVGTPFPMTPIPRATRIDGSPTPNPLVTEPYTACYEDRIKRKNWTLFPGGTCADEACVADGLEAGAYAAWKQFMMESHQMDEQAYNEHIEIVDVLAEEWGSEVWVWMRYVVVNDWARIFREDTLNFEIEPDAEMYRTAAEKTYANKDQINMSSVASVAEIEAVFAACDPGLEINWCWLDYPTFGGRLYVTGFYAIDLEADRCMEAAVYVDNGEVWYCRERPCRLDE